MLIFKANPNYAYVLTDCIDFITKGMKFFFKILQKTRTVCKKCCFLQAEKKQRTQFTCP